MNLELQTYLERVAEEERIPGMCVSVLTEGVTSTVTIGVQSTSDHVPMGGNAEFPLACISNLLVSVLALQCVANGDLDLHSSISRYLPELRGTKAGSEVLVWHLLSHSSGIKGIGTEQSSASSSCRAGLNLLLREAPVFVPGTLFNYGNTEHIIAGEILRRLTGKDVTELVEKSILCPLRLMRGHRDDSHKAVEGHRWNSAKRRFEQIGPRQISQFTTPVLERSTLSTQDMIRLVRLFWQTPDSSPSSSVLNPAVVSLLKRQVVRFPRPPPSFVRVRNGRVLISYGLGYGAYSDGTFGISGSTASQCCGVHFDPETAVAVAVGINARAPRMRNRVISTVLSQLLPDRKCVFSDGRAQPTFETNELIGDYIGGVDGQKVEVSVGSNCHTIRILEPVSRRVLIGQFNLTDQRHVEFLPAARNLPIFFFREWQTGDPCVMCDWYAFKNVRHCRSKHA
jgi:CubicO group peptidase (beta-lactamase class C family)